MASGLNGIAAMKRRVRQGVADKVERIENALHIETEIEVTEVKRRTPVKHGTLRGTVHQVGPSRKGRAIVTYIVAGGPSAPYAFIVHEDLEAFHKVGQAKYIESVLLESRPHMGARVARRVKTG